ncbi:CPBP family intramembrane metalloprotease [Paenibacillus sp. HN-1]|nr:type II CAAX endopeptidase family protein [Paenibacillus sp. CGMCC 1.18879]MBY9080152.1 CPBP family intramembrane metalloprotease [Paenibacillus sp. CGMCC 1.18879]MBY9087774.1 CPBP family intramembrane metalloprotease [Paenibacillus sinensis]
MMKMFTGLKDSVKAAIYTVLVLALGLGCSYIPGISGFFYMLTPALAVLIMMLVVTRDGYSRKGWAALGLKKLPGWRGAFFALLIPLIPLAVGSGIVWALGWSKLDIPADFQGIPWKAFPAVIVLVYVKSVCVESMGEELGWRGYLLPRMLGMGTKKAMLLNGLIHGLWHFPVILNTTEYHSNENLWLLLPLALASTVFLAPVIGELRLRTGSVWAASMLHTSHNLFWMILSTVLAEQSQAAKYIAGDMSVVVVLFYAGLTLYLWKRRTPGTRGAESGKAA